MFLTFVYWAFLKIKPRNTVFDQTTFVELWRSFLHLRNCLATFRSFEFFLINNAKNVVDFTTQKIDIQRFIRELLSTNISLLDMFKQYCTTMAFLISLYMYVTNRKICTWYKCINMLNNVSIDWISGFRLNCNPHLHDTSAIASILEFMW